MDLKKHLSKKDACDLLEIISGGLDCRSEDDFKDLVFELKNLMAFESVLCGYQNFTESILTGEISEPKMVSIGFPEEFLNWYYSGSHHVNDTVLIEFLRTFEFQNWSDVTKRCLAGKKDLVTIQVEAFGLMDGFAYGARDFDLTMVTCFMFAGKQVENNERTKTIIEYSVPHLSEVLKRLMREKTKIRYALTSRELEVLKWLKEGKSSWDISIILARSESVINFHVKNILRKLDAMNRTHAVAIAVENGLVGL